MKKTRSYQFLRRLTVWRDLYLDLRGQPIYVFEREMSIGEVRKLFGDSALKRAAVIVHEPMEISMETRT